MSQFVGPYKVIGIVKLDHTTPAGNEIVRVEYEGRTPEIMPRKAFDLVATAKPGDLTEVRDTKMRELVNELVKIVMEYDVKAIDIPHLSKEMSNKMFDAFDRASNFLWTGDDRTWIPGDNAIHQRTLIEADIALSKIQTKDDAAEPADDADDAGATEGE